MRRTLALVCGALFAAHAIVGTADARTQKVRTTLDASSITWEESATSEEVVLVEGTIGSDKSKCLAGRSIDIQVSPNQTLQSPFGTGTTDANGHFAVEGSAPNDWYYTIYVAKKWVGSVVCKSTAAYGQFEPQ